MPGLRGQVPKPRDVHDLVDITGKEGTRRCDALASRMDGRESCGDDGAVPVGEKDDDGLGRQSLLTKSP